VFASNLDFSESFVNIFDETFIYFTISPQNTFFSFNNVKENKSKISEFDPLKIVKTFKNAK
jgi:hypothetical protein